MLKDSSWCPLTIGLNQWNKQVAPTVGGQAIQNLVVTGSLVTIIPLIIAFLALQKCIKKCGRSRRRQRIVAASIATKQEKREI